MASFDHTHFTARGRRCHGDGFGLRPHSLRVQGDEGSRLSLSVEVTKGHFGSHYMEQWNLYGNGREDTRQLVSDMTKAELLYSSCCVVLVLYNGPLTKLDGETRGHLEVDEVLHFGKVRCV